MHLISASVPLMKSTSMKKTPKPIDGEIFKKKYERKCGRKPINLGIK